MEIKLYLRMLLRGWWLVAVTILVAVNVALVFAYLTKPIYQSSVRFSVSPSASLADATSQQALNSLEALDKRSIIQTYAEFLNSQRVWEETLLATGLDVASMIRYKHRTVVLPDANVLELTVEGPNAETAAMLANNTGQNAIRHIKQLYKVYDLNTLDPAVASLIPVRPQPLRDAGVAALLGLVIGAALAITSEQIRIPLDAYRQRARLDPVSMVLNTRYLQHRLAEMISHNPPQMMALGLVRLNGLRDLIDTLPQSVVQQLLRQVTAILAKELRGNDVIGRWNDTTFALVLPATGEAAANRTMDRVRAALLQPVTLANYGEIVQLNPAVSMACYREGETLNDVTRRAEEALEHSRDAGTAPAAG